LKPVLNPEYWSELYKNNDAPWDTGSITTPLKNYFDQLTNKNISVLIPGAGNAYEAEYLVKSGFRKVYVCDYAAEPLKNLKKRCPEISADHLLHCNFFELERKSEFDLIVEQTFFCALDVSLRKKYFGKMHELLKPGGRLVGLLFVHDFGRDIPPFGGTREEYLEYIGNGFKINVFESCYNSIKPRAGRELFMNLEKIR
jgi:thiopurine S-methyltransferase